jgi:methanogenic corrinoid protein MtbC1
MAAFIHPAAANECSDGGQGTASLDEGYRDLIVEVESEQTAIADQLAKTIEGEIIPRLLLAHKRDPIEERPTISNADFVTSDVQEFSALIHALDGSRAYKFIEDQRLSGRSLESIIVDVLAPAASYLGELWSADRCTFTEVTVGLSRLRQILREISPEFENEGSSWRHGRRVLLVPTPGEQHTFGLLVVEAFFRREGWDVCGGTIENTDEIMRLVSDQWFAIAGFSLSSERFLSALAPLVRAIRRESCNQDIGILVGGPLFLRRPELVAEIGADASAADGYTAVLRARDLLAQTAART